MSQLCVSPGLCCIKSCTDHYAHRYAQECCTEIAKEGVKEEEQRHHKQARLSHPLLADRTAFANHKASHNISDDWNNQLGDAGLHLVSGTTISTS